jgi:hypothetical protein
VIISSWRARSFAAALAVSLVAVVPTAVHAAEQATAGDDDSVSRKPTKPLRVLAARGGRDFIVAAESSKLTAVGRVSAIKKIDLHGYAADLRVDQALRGAAKPGAVLKIAWEELAPSRPVRFSEGQRVLVCLDSAPNYTLWQKRFPDNLADVLAVSREGEAFLRDPDSKTLHLLGHYLALGKGARNDPAALGYLVDMVAAAPEIVALNVLDSINARDNVATMLPDGAGAVLAGVAGDDSRSIDVRRSVLALIGRAKIRTARADIQPLTRPGADLRAAALHTVGILDDGLSAEVVAELILDEDGNVRAVAVLYLRTVDASETLVRLALTDRSPAVRVAAAHRLFVEQGKDALDDLAPALGDEDATVRTVVARDVAGLGDEVVEQLVGIADTGSERQAQGVVLAFTMMGGAGGNALSRLYKEHKNPKIRALAGITLGRMPGHSH